MFPQKRFCINCHKPIDVKDNFCNYCRAEILRCAICFTPFNIDDKVVRCPYCRSLFHTEHLENWLSFSDSCPHCKNKMRFEDFTKISLETFHEFRFDLDLDEKADPTILAKLRFQEKFWRSQELILEKFEEVLAEVRKKFYVVSPPGSGKTIIGLEIIRRLERNALVLTPNTSTQTQWIDKIKMFLDPQLNISVTNIGTISADSLAPITVMTYQRFSTYSESESVLALAMKELLKDKPKLEQELKEKLSLFSSNNSPTLLELAEFLQKNDPDTFKKLLSPYIKKVRYQVLKNNMSAITPEEFLHPNTLEIIKKLKEKGIGVIILDECHHLTAVWAYIVRYLIKEFGDPFIVGLTATPPFVEEENYRKGKKGEEKNKEPHIYELLFGAVDIIIPTPAAVKQKNLAPYQDLLYLSYPTEKEKQALTSYEDEITKILLLEDLEENWISPQQWLKKIKKFKGSIEELNGNEKYILLEQYYSFLQSEYIQQGRNKVKEGFLSHLNALLFKKKEELEDIILQSERKALAALEILKREYDALQDKLRAAIIFDSYQEKNMLNLLTKIASDSYTCDLDPVLILKDVIYADKDLARKIKREYQTFASKFKFEIHVDTIAVSESIHKIVGTGSDWHTGTYVLFLTYLFETGLTKCIMGSRSLLGEGWDSKKLNCLIDLTSIAAYQTTVQIKGRSYRIDEEWQNKVANNWDIAVIEHHLPLGYWDFERIIRKHQHFYSISEDGVIEKGVGHIYPSIIKEIKEFKIDVKRFNEFMFSKAVARERCLKLWNIGEKYRNIETIAFNIKFGENELVVPYLEDKFTYYIKGERAFYERKAEPYITKKTLEELVDTYFKVILILKAYLQNRDARYKKLSRFAEKIKRYSVSQRTGGYVRLLIESSEQEIKDYIKDCFTLNNCKYALPLSYINKNVEFGIVEKVGDSVLKRAKLRYLFGLPFLNQINAYRAYTFWTRLGSFGPLVDKEIIAELAKKQRKEIVIDEKIVWT